MPVDIRFQSLLETHPGKRWQRLFQHLWPGYRKWFLSEGIESRATYLACLRALRTHMPELLPCYEKMTELAGGGDLEARLLSFYCPPPYLSGCSQAIWLGNEPMLVRNYDYSPRLCDGVILQTAWNGQRVIGMGDGLWGLLDGMNQAGLALSLTFGGRRVVGDGFGVPLILRYVLEFCSTTIEATAALSRIPCHMTYNVTVVDAKGRYATVYMAPDRNAIITDSRVATNHQERVEWQRHARVTASVEREKFLLKRLTLHPETAERFIGAFLKPPLYSTHYEAGFGTLYTAVYRPGNGSAEYHWPGMSWCHQLDQMQQGSRYIRYPDDESLNIPTLE